MQLKRQFASDNYAGICPEAWAAIQEANAGHAPGYGNDQWTAQAADLIREVFETNCDVFFVFNGTSANSLALAAMCQSYHSVLCHQTAHIETDECGAPEFFSNGSKILLLPGENGKIDPQALTAIATSRTDLHFPKPRVVSITQATESGTLYSVSEIADIAQRARALGLGVHMDGARFANAVATMNVPPKAMTWAAGVDVMSFGATKNGASVGEAVVFFRRELAHEFEYRCKQAGQLASKMRFLSAGWVGLLRDGAWLKNARHANAMAQRLEERLKAVGVGTIFPRQVNSVFVRLPEKAMERLREQGWAFYTFIAQGGARLMCAWDTQPEDVDAFAAAITAAMRQEQ